MQARMRHHEELIEKLQRYDTETRDIQKRREENLYNKLVTRETIKDRQKAV